MAISRFTHPMTAVKALAAAVALMAFVGAARAEPCPDQPQNNLCEVVHVDYSGTGRGGFESDGEYFSRTGFHYGWRHGEIQLR